MANSRFYSSTAQQTNLTGSITGVSTVMTVGSSAGYPGTVPFTVSVDYGSASEELVDVTAVAGLSWTITRGVDGTSATSHNSGAVVRHVSSARDFTDSRTHEASTANVHGVNGVGNNLVGSTSTQTLTNKTLTSPTINGATVTGTVAGSPTFSGAPTFSGSVTMSGGGSITGTYSGAHTYSGAVTLSAGGSLAGTFSGSPTFSGTPTLAGGAVANAVVRASRSASTDPGFSTSVFGDTVDRYNVTASGTVEWGSGSATRDVNLYRSGVNILKTDDSLTVAGDLVVSGNLSTTGIGGVMFARKTADTARTSTFGADDPHLTFSIVANATYEMEGMLFFNSTTTANDLVVDFTAPVGAGGQWMGIGQPTPASGTDGTVRTMSTDVDASRAYGVDTDINNKLGIILRGIIVNGATSGTYALNWALNNVGGTVTLFQNCWMKLTRVA